MNIKFVWAVVCVTVTGCSTFRGQASVGWPWADGDGNVRIPCKSEKCTTTESLQAYLIATQFCRDLSNYYEAGGQTSGISQLAVGAVGVLSGSVAAPIAHGTAAKAWSGLSGATNALQIPMQQTFSASLATARQNAVANAAQHGAEEYGKAKSDENAKVVASVNMALECALAPSTADQQALQSLSRVTTTTFSITSQKP